MNAPLIRRVAAEAIAHFDPVVTLAARFTGRSDPEGLALRDVAAYVCAQAGGAIGGAVLADAMFAGPLVTFATPPGRPRQR
ncbi:MULTISPECIES: hypothetical protein [unclassified Streptomyces]|uniref:hypothetical protein n=1 Tax=unclassified Streptomyces TaxID=2593676 RepID=UPI0026996733|nr:hypothetical protein [Streptomyces sp. WAC 01420]